MRTTGSKNVGAGLGLPLKARSWNRLESCALGTPALRPPSPAGAGLETALLSFAGKRPRGGQQTEFRDDWSINVWGFLLNHPIVQGLENAGHSSGRSRSKSLTVQLVLLSPGACRSPRTGRADGYVTHGLPHRGADGDVGPQRPFPSTLLRGSDSDSCTLWGLSK